MKIEMYLPVTGRNTKKKSGFQNTTNKIYCLTNPIFYHEMVKMGLENLILYLSFDLYDTFVPENVTAVVLPLVRPA